MDFSWLVLVGTFISIILYSQLAANVNLVLEGHDVGHVSQCRLRTLWFARTAEQFDSDRCLICGPLEVAVGC